MAVWGGGAPTPSFSKAQRGRAVEQETASHTNSCPNVMHDHLN